MAYAEDSIDWWTSRSLSREYQGAYNNISTYVPKEGKIFLEVACGPGEILKRVWKLGNYDLVIGSDASMEMLETAQARLQAAELEAAIETDATKINQRRKGIVLVLDDLLESKFPDSFVDTVLFAFPEIGLDCTPQPIDKELLGKLAEKVYKKSGEQLTPYDIMMNTINLRAQYHISRVSKPNSCVIIVHYHIILDNEHVKDMEEGNSLLYSINGMKVTQSLFFNSPKIFADTISEVQDRVIKGDNPMFAHLERGYNIQILCKNKKA